MPFSITRTFSHRLCYSNLYSLEDKFSTVDEKIYTTVAQEHCRHFYSLSIVSDHKLN